MVMLPKEYNSETISDSNLLAPGAYVVVVTNSELSPTKSGTGQKLRLTFQVVEGDAKGRYIWQNYNIVNENKTSEDIAWSELKQIVSACGKERFVDSNEIHGIPFFATVIVEEGKNGFSAQNKIKKASSMSPEVSAALKKEIAADTPPWAS